MVNQIKDAAFSLTWSIPWNVRFFTTGLERIKDLQIKKFRKCTDIMSELISVF